MKRISLALACLAMILPPLSAQEPSGMLTEKNSEVIYNVEMEADLVVVGGGLSGICAAVSAARHGAKVVLVQDRPVLGGNASSEIRMGICGAKSAEAYEAGILEEMQISNFYYNPQQRYTLWDDVMYSTVVSEKNITLLLNTSVNGVVMDGARIAAVKAWNTNAYTNYTIKAKLFADCSGDSILRLSGAQFRKGRELPSEFNETYLHKGGDDHTMGNSILLQFHKTDKDVPFVAPDWAYHFTDEDFKELKKSYSLDGVKYNYKNIKTAKENNFWWVEFGGHINTIKDANAIQYELKRIAYGIWEYMKNHPDGRCNGYELDWIGSIPGKRESARYVGAHILNQHDITSGGHFDNNVAYGGWTLDDHETNGFHNNLASREYKAPIPFGIPFSCLYSANVPNLLFAGRNISASHMAFSATRVMATCATLGQAAGTAAAIALQKGVDPADVDKDYIGLLQDTLEDDDCMIPYRWRKVSPLTLSARTDPANEVLRNGIDRIWDKKDNGVWAAPGEESISYCWKKPVTVNSVRIIFDSDFKYRGKRMPKLEGSLARVEMPSMMAKGFRIEVRDRKGNWTTVYEDKLNLRRLRKIDLGAASESGAAGVGGAGSGEVACATSVNGIPAGPLTKVYGLRLVVTETWGGEKAHIFALDVL